MFGFIFFVFICVVINIQVFFAGNYIYSFYRNFFKSRIIQLPLTIYAIALFLVYLKSADELKDLIVFLVIIISLAFMIIYGYFKFGEGVFTNGVIFRGSFISWKYITGYKIDDSYSENCFLLVLYIKSNKNVGMRTFALEKEIKNDLNASLSQFIGQTS